MADITQQLRDFIAKSKRNPNPNFKVGDQVYYFVTAMEFEQSSLQSKFYTMRVDAEVVHVHSTNKSDIKLTVPPFTTEKEFNGEYLFS